MRNKIKIVGIGGIGLPVAESTAFMLNSQFPNISLELIDGDKFETKNASRQNFAGLGNKAQVTAYKLKKFYSLISISHQTEFAKLENLENLIHNGDIVLLAVDNHWTRRIVSDYTNKLSEITVISGRNGIFEGIVQIHHRINGKDMNLPISNVYYPDIQNATLEEFSQNHDIENCGENIQMWITNQAVANQMVIALNLFLNDRLSYDEINFDLETGTYKTFKRPFKEVNYE